MIQLFNPFVPNASFLYPLKQKKTLRFSDVFRGVEKGCIGNEWVNPISTNFTKGKLTANHAHIDYMKLKSE